MAINFFEKNTKVASGDGKIPSKKDTPFDSTLSSGTVVAGHTYNVSQGGNAKGKANCTTGASTNPSKNPNKTGSFIFLGDV